MTILLSLFCIVVAVFLLTALVGAPYVPTRGRDVELMFDDVYNITDHDVLIDIGSGDGKVCIAAANRGARAVGYEINPFLVLVSIWRARRQPRVSFRLANFWMVKLEADTTVIYTFGDGRDIAKMADWVQRQADNLGHKLYFLSYAFEVPGRSYKLKGKMHYLYEFLPSLQTKKT